MRTWFGDGWTVGPRRSIFAEMRPGGMTPPVDVRLPHDATLGTERDPSGNHAVAYHRPGVWSYETTLHAPAEWRERRVRLHFEGVYRDAAVFVNHDLVTTHAFGYSEFVAHLDPFLRLGQDNSITVECRAGDDSRWYSGSGIFRPVWLHVQTPVHLAIDGVWVRTPEVADDGAVVAVSAEVRNESSHTATVRLRHELMAPDGTTAAVVEAPVTVLPGEEVADVQRVFVPSPVLWSPEAPNLYTCRTRLLADDATLLEDQTVHFGVRSLRLDTAHGLRLNGRVTKLRGACVHHDNGPIGAATIGRAEERRVERLKAAGFNAIRSAHNPMSRAMLDACDRLGVLVMDESWDMWTESKSDDDHALRFPNSWRSDLAAMVRKDRNHPSVVMYSIGNEIPEVGGAHGAAWSRRLAAEVRRLDPDRYVTNAVQPILAIRDMLGEIRTQGEQMKDELTELGLNSIMAAWGLIKDRVLRSPMVAELTEEVFASCDVAGYNYLENRYLIDHDLFPNRVMVGSETYAAEIDRNWALIMRHPHLIGDFTWTGWDYLGEVGIGRTEFADPDEPDSDRREFAASYPWLLAMSGDIDVIGDRRPQSWYREIAYGLSSTPVIVSHRPEHFGRTPAHTGPWSWDDVVRGWTWPGQEGSPTRVDVYAAADEVELFLDDEALGRRPVERLRASFDVPYRPGELTAIAWRGDVEVGRSTLRSATGSVRLHALAEHDTVVADADALAYIGVSIVDATGTLCHSTTADVTVEVHGPATLQGVASADPGPEHPYTEPRCRTYLGRAMVVLRPTGPGEIAVTVRADGFEPAVAAVTVLAAAV